eukprot:COSAG01_NODE_4447_length_5012_cov_7.832078_3_plen_181_part_00
MSKAAHRATFRSGPGAWLGDCGTGRQQGHGKCEDGGGRLHVGGQGDRKGRAPRYGRCTVRCLLAAAACCALQVCWLAGSCYWPAAAAGCCWLLLPAGSWLAARRAHTSATGSGDGHGRRGPRRRRPGPVRVGTRSADGRGSLNTVCPAGIRPTRSGSGHCARGDAGCGYICGVGTGSGPR